MDIVKAIGQWYDRKLSGFIQAVIDKTPRAFHLGKGGAAVPNEVSLAHDAYICKLRSSNTSKFQRSRRKIPQS